MPETKDLTREAGGVLDANVAEKVMGWSVYGSVGDGSTEFYNKWLVHFRRKDSTFLYLDKAGRLWRYAEKLTEAHDDGQPQSEVWSPSVDIQAAIEVAERIHDLQPRFVLEAQPFVRPRVWWCSVYGHDRVEAPTAPLAICLAALKYVERNPIT